MNTTKIIKLTAKTQFTDIIQDGAIVARNIDYAGNLLLCVARQPLQYRKYSQGGASHAVTTPKIPQIYDIYHYIHDSDTLCHYATIENEPFNIHYVQLLTNGHILLACSRSQYRSATDFDKNGRIYTADGQFIQDILLGDGIENMQVACDDVIWTSYFDEGVFGNFGWQDPVGSSGLVAFNKMGDTLYDYEPSFGLDSIDDCYALNVSSKQDTWIYYYYDFNLVHIKDQTPQNYWQIPIAGCSQFAISGYQVVFDMGYEDKTNLYAMRLTDNHQVEDLIKLAIYHDKKRLTKQNSAFIARGDKIYILDMEDNLLFTASVDELVWG